MSSDADLHQLAIQVGSHLLQSRRRLVTAESCTGGWLGKVATDVAGSSAWFAGGAIVYSNELKQRSVDVRAETLAQHGAVSEAVVLEMAQGALRHLGGEIAVAVSGIAGPDGGSIDKPIGTVWFAWATLRNGLVAIAAEKKIFTGDRDQVRRQSVFHALMGVLNL